MASRNGIEGVRRHYSWQACRGLPARIQGLTGKSQPIPSGRPASTRAALPRPRDIHRPGSEPGRQPDCASTFVEAMRETADASPSCIATGRRIDSALALMKKQGIPTPDVLISSLGTRIHYGRH